MNTHKQSVAIFDTGEGWCDAGVEFVSLPAEVDLDELRLEYEAMLSRCRAGLTKPLSSTEFLILHGAERGSDVFEWQDGY
jgi:hypothetical protein